MKELESAHAPKDDVSMTALFTAAMTARGEREAAS